ncbi:MAG: hypothetical protein Fur0042_16020 [Cyanophyceae cyanobacterium]
MNLSDRARVLMMRHHHVVKNRQQSMLGRAIEGMELGEEAVHHWSCIQGKIDGSVRTSYDRSGATMS